MKYVFISIGLVLLVVGILWFKPVENFNLARKYYLNPCPVDYPERQSDFSQHFIDFNLDDYYQSLDAYRNDFTFDQVATIDYSQKEYPIFTISTNNEEALKRMVILSGVHGNEVAGALALLELLSELQDKSEIYNDWELTILAPANPVGLDYMSRYNGNGCDINRDFRDFHTHESQVQRDLIQRIEPDVILSWHESPREGFFFIPNIHVTDQLNEKVLMDLRRSGVQLGTENTIGLTISTPGMAPHGRMTNFILNIINVGTLGTYGHENNYPVITTESSWILENIDERVNSHVIVTKSILENFEL